MLIIKFLIVFIIVLLFCQLFLATVQEGFKEGVDETSCPGVNQIPLLQNRVDTMQTKVDELDKKVTYLTDQNQDQFKPPSSANPDALQAVSSSDEDEEETPIETETL